MLSKNFLQFLLSSFILCTIWFYSIASAATSQEVEQTLRDSSHLPLENRLWKIAASFNNSPFQWYPLGEGNGADVDPQPLYRFDVFDCQTYVETVLALSQSDTLKTFSERIQAIRYSRGVVSFETRNHFPDIDWNRNNILSGALKDITSMVAGAGNTAKIETPFDRGQFYKTFSLKRVPMMKEKPKSIPFALEKLKKLGEGALKEVATIEFLKLDSLIVSFKGNKPPSEYKPLVQFIDPKNSELAQKGIPLKEWYVNTTILSRLPSGVLISIVRPKWDGRGHAGTPINISHRFLFFWRNGRARIWHMSLYYKKVIEADFFDYLSGRRLDPTVQGIQILQPMQLL